MVDRMHHKVLSFQEENKQLIEHVEYLEDELAQTNKQLKELKSLLKRYVLDRQDDFPSTESSHPAYFPNGKCTKEMNVELLLARDEKDELSKHISRLPNSFVATKKEANFMSHRYARTRRMDTY